MVQHFRECHPDSSWIYARQQQNYEPELLHRAVVDSAAPVITRLKVGADAFAGLALRQPGSIVVSLETARIRATVFAHFLRHVAWGETIGAAAWHWTTWTACLCAMLPGRVWRLCPNFWRAYIEAVLHGTFKKVPLSAVRAKPAPGSSQASMQAAPGDVPVCLGKLQPSDRIAAAEHLCLVLQAGQSFMRDLGREHEHQVIYSHGDHVPLEVRSAAAVAFWLPDLLDIDQNSMRSSEAKEFWSSRVSAFSVAAEYVAQRLSAYRWPTEYELRSQYRDLMLHWARLCKRGDVQEFVLPSQPGSQQASMQPTTGESEHGRAVVGTWRPSSSSSLQASQQPAAEKLFQWERWWQLVHTGCLPSGMVVNCVPEDYVGAFSVFHFTGMFGTSEAHAESVGSTLKRYAKSLSTGRVVESSILRSVGLSGCGGGGEDGFLELCWADFFGDSKHFSFHFRNSTRRRKRYVQGRGSATIERLLTGKNAQRNRWTERDLLNTAHAMGAGTGLKKSSSWGKALKAARTSEAG